MVKVVGSIADPVVYISSLPDLHLSADHLTRPMGRPTFDQLHSALESDVPGGSQEDMEVVWHQYKFVEFVFVVGAVAK